AKLVEVEDVRGALRVAPFSLLVGLSHPQALAFLGVAGIAIAFTRRPLLRNLVTHAIALVGGLIVVVPWISSALRGPAPPSAAYVVLANVVLYLALPMAVRGPMSHWHTYPRYATFTLLAMLALPRPRLEGRRAWLLAPGIAAALFVDLAVLRQFRDFDSRVR